MTIPIFVINLKEDTERWHSISDQINTLGLSFSRFNAYHGEYIPERWRNQFFPKSSEPFRPTLTDGQLGCYVSHLACMNMLLEGKHLAAMIFEDDIVINSKISGLFSNIDKLPKNWDFIHLSGRPKSAFISLGDIAPDLELVKFSRIPTDASGYIVSRSGAEKFIYHKQGDLRRVPNDIEVKNAYIRKLNVYGCLPPPICQTPKFPSAIDRVDSRKRKRKYGTHKSSFKMLIARAKFNIRNLTIKCWLKCFCRNAYVHLLCRRINRQNLPLYKLRVKDKY